MASIDASTSGAGGVITTADNTGILNLQSGGATIATVSSTGLSLATGKTLSVGGAVGSPFSMKNRIINGDMRIAQRATGAVNNLATDAYQGIDRWSTYGNAADKYSTQQSTTAPTGFTNSMLITSLAATSVGTSGLYLGIQYVEGFNCADLAWGTASAQTVTLSFWVRSSLTGTFGGSILNNARDRCYIFSYTISSANTWEQKTITIAGDTSGTWLTNNGRGIGLYFSFGTGSSLSGTAGSWGSSELYAPTGSVSVVGTNGATFYITGVQLEQGSSATSFEWLPYTTELQLCQRYYAKTYDIGTVPGTASAQSGALCTIANGANTLFTFQHPVNMRAIPTVSFYSPNAGTINNIQSGSTSVAAASNGPINGTKNSMCFSNACITADVYAHMVASAEL